MSARDRYSSLRGSIGAEVRGDFGGGGVQLRPYAAAVIEKDFTGDERSISFAQTSAPGIVNSYRVEDGSTKAYGRLSVGMSAAILSGVSLNANVSGTLRKDQGNETSGHTLGRRARHRPRPPPNPVYAVGGRGAGRAVSNETGGPARAGPPFS